MGKVASSFVVMVGLAVSGLLTSAAIADDVPDTTGSASVSSAKAWAKLGNEVAEHIAGTLGSTFSHGIYVEYLDSETAFSLGFRQSLIRALAAKGLPIAATRSAADYRLAYGIQTMYLDRKYDPLTEASQQITVTLTSRAGGKILENEFHTSVPEQEAGQIDPGRPAPPDYYAWTGDPSPTTRIIPINRSFNK